MRETAISASDTDLWVVAVTQEVSEQHAKKLQDTAELFGLELLILDSRESDIGMLDVFIATHAETTISFVEKNSDSPNISEIRKKLSEITESPHYVNFIKHINGLLSGSLLGWEDICLKSRDWVKKTTSTIIKSNSTYAQDIGISEPDRNPPIARTEIREQLDTWWNNWTNINPFAVLVGEEGTGKTWAIFDWFLALDDVNSDLLFLPVTSNLLSGSTSLEAVIVSAIKKIDNSKTNRFWERRLENWINGLTNNFPRIILFFDGLYERPRMQWQQLIVNTKRDEDERYFITLIMTDRPYTWSEKKRDHNSFRRINTNGYSDVELDQALKHSGYTRENLPNDLIELIRKPMFCNLAIKYCSSLLESGDLTPDRLHFIANKHKAEFKIGNVTLNDDEYEQLLIDIAKRHKEGLESYRKQEIASLLEDTVEIDKKLVKASCMLAKLIDTSDALNYANSLCPSELIEVVEPECNSPFLDFRYWFANASKELSAKLDREIISSDNEKYLYHLLWIRSLQGFPLSTEVKNKVETCLSHPNTTVRAYDFLFNVPDSPSSEQAKAEQLMVCKSDIELLNIVTIAEYYGKKDWVVKKAEELIERDQIWKRAKGLLLLGFSNCDEEVFLKVKQSCRLTNTWAENIIEKSSSNHERNQWAKHWYEQYLTLDSDSEAWVKLQLFFKCVDSRYKVWAKNIS